LVDIINIGYLSTIAYFSYIFIFDSDLGLKSSGEISVDLGIEMWIIYLILPISAVFGLIMVIFKLKDDVLKPMNEEKEIIEELTEEFEVGK